MQMLGIIYDFWQAISGISGGITALGLILAKLPKRKQATTNEGRVLAKVKNAVIVTAAFIMILSCGVGFALTRVPSLRGSIVADAEQKLIDNGLKMALPAGRERNDTTYSENVSSQSPDVGELMIKGSTVIVYPETATKQGETEMTVVPVVVGEMYKDAALKLEEADLRYTISVNSEEELDVVSAYVIRQSIIGGTTIPKNSVIEIELSTKQETSADMPEMDVEWITVPSVIGMEQSAATDRLLESGFGNVIVFGDDVAAEHYYIIEQSMPAGDRVLKGLAIELTRIAKPLYENATVPNVVGMEQTAATKLLTESGLQFQVWWTDNDDFRYGETYYIVDQSIPAGSTVKTGSLVRLELSSM